MAKHELTHLDHIERHILTIRGQKVILDRDLAKLYGVDVKRLNEQIRRNADRFPEDFMFALTWQEFASLRSQIATSKGRGGRRYAPNAFTEHGVVMAATVLNSPVAVEMSIHVVRAFVRMRRMIGAVQGLARKLDALERKMIEHDKHFAVVFEAIRQLMEPPPEEPKGRIGFHKR